MIANIVVIIFILGMIFWWSQQGFFSAFIHLCLTIAAGTIALSIWEPLVLKLLIFYMPQVAWAVGLLAPFALLLFGLRFAVDRLVPGNVQMMPLISKALGGACGLGSGVLTAGLVFIGLGFLPLGPSALGGYQPYAMAGGSVVPTGQRLWISVDTMASGFFTNLAGGSFHPWSGKPLALYQGDVAANAATSRLRDDENGSIVAIPGAVGVNEVFIQALPVEQLPDEVKLALGDPFNLATNQLVTVDTIWKKDIKTRGTYDQDDTARIPPSQVRLMTWRKHKGATVVDKHTPIAVAKEIAVDQRRFIALGGGAVPYSLNNNDKLAWVFIISGDEMPKFLFVRNLRLPLGAAVGGDDAVQRLATVMGQPEAEPAADGETADAADPSGAQDQAGPPSGDTPGNIEMTNRINTTFSRNGASGLTYDGSSVVRGEARVRGGIGRGSKNTKVDSVYCPSHLGMVRVVLDREQAQGLFGKARSQAKSLGGIFLVDSRGERHQPMAYNWVPKEGDQRIYVDADNPIRSAQQLPIPQMKDGDKLYLFFRVPADTVIVSYEIGKQAEPVNLKVPKVQPPKKRR